MFKFKQEVYWCWLRRAAEFLISLVLNGILPSCDCEQGPGGRQGGEGTLPGSRSRVRSSSSLLPPNFLASPSLSLCCTLRSLASISRAQLLRVVAISLMAVAMRYFYAFLEYLELDAIPYLSAAGRIAAEGDGYGACRTPFWPGSSMYRSCAE